MGAKSERQRKAAVRELINRDVLGYEPEQKATRPFGSATREQIMKFTR